jgi:hypothetical protein
VAEGIRTVLLEGSFKPLYARVSGAEEDAAQKRLEGTPVNLFRSAPEAVAAVVRPS